VTNRVEAARSFDHTVVMKEGRIAEQGAFDDLSSRKGALNDLLEFS
jgi:ABC-type multidrug transport system fused ATPase/permease subunit